MVSDKLAIEQFKTAHFHPRHQPRQRHFRRVGCARKHAFAKKGAAHRKPVKPADQFAVLPAFHAVCQAPCVQHAKRRLDICVDPRLIAVRRDRRTRVVHLRKFGVGGDAKSVLPDCFGQRL